MATGSFNVANLWISVISKYFTLNVPPSTFSLASYFNKCQRIMWARSKLEELQGNWLCHCLSSIALIAWCKGQKVGVWRESAVLVIVWDRESYADDLVGPASNDRIGGWWWEGGTPGMCCHHIQPAAWGAPVALSLLPLLCFSLVIIFCFRWIAPQF